MLAAAQRGRQAGAAIAELDAWTARWRHSAEASCKATVVDRVQPAELDALRRSCLDQLVERLAPIVTLVTNALSSASAPTAVISTTRSSSAR